MKTSTNSKTSDILDAHKFLQYEKSVIRSSRMSETLDIINRDGLKILDVGGASGLFLSELSKRANYQTNLYNLEVDEFYKTKQVNKQINFLHGSILNSGLEEEMFDIVTFGDVLHHLIGKNRHETRENQQKAVQEIFRIAKKGGHIIFSEEVNNVKIFALIVYSLSKLANKLKINSDSFGAGKVVVFFPNQEDIARIIGNVRHIYPARVVKKYFKRWNMALKWKVTLLMSNVGHINYVIHKTSGDK